MEMPTERRFAMERRALSRSVPALSLSGCLELAAEPSLHSHALLNGLGATCPLGKHMELQDRLVGLGSAPTTEAPKRNPLELPQGGLWLPR